MKSRLKALLKVKRSVRFKVIPYEVTWMFDALLEAGRKHQVQPVITGSSCEGYPKGKVHDQGYGLDVRTRNLEDPDQFAEDVRLYLGAVSPHYKVLYGDPAHLDHIHIGFSWYYARKI